MAILGDGLIRLAPRHRRAVLTYLRQAPEANTYLLAQLERGALVRDDVAGPMLGFFASGVLEGVAVCGSNLVLSRPASAAAIEAVADFARRGRYMVRVAVGEDGILDAFMTAYGRDFRPIQLERAGQQLFRVTPALLQPPARLTRLRVAELRDLDAVIAVDRAMVVEELGFDPFIHDGESYREGWRRRIREGRAWVVGPVGGALAFKLEQSAVCDEAIQISGVYTVPAERRKGLARDAMARMCERLLLDVPAVTLYVHKDNYPALRLYRRLGFEAIGLVRSIWFEPGR